MVMVDSPEMQSLPRSEQSETSSSATEDRVPEGKSCRGCDAIIVRRPGQRGILPSYCDDCKQKRPSKSSSKSSGEGRSKAEKESDAIAEHFRQQLNKAAIMVGIFDPFDGFVLATQSKPITENLRSVMVSHERVRKLFEESEGSGGLFGLGFSLIFGVTLPILAHHEIIPEKVAGKDVREFLEKLPAFLHKLNKAAEQAEDAIAEKFQQDMGEEDGAKAA